MRQSDIIMIRRETVLSDEDLKGNVCNICTGCGRCMRKYVKGSSAGLNIVTEHGLTDVEIIHPVSDGSRRERLVIADIGTTTVAVQLCDRHGNVEADYVCVNPQVIYGTDVLSRICAAKDRETADKMKTLVTQEIEKALRSFRPYLVQDETMFMILAGNTTMMYLLMGYDPSELGRAPFTATHMCAEEFMFDGTPCVTFPCMSAFVGGDIAAGIYACGMRESHDLTLLIDLGTNGEIVLGNDIRRIACATAAGPAFEGGVNRGVWGADMVSLTARLRREGILDETGLLSDEYFDKGVLIGGVRVTQQAIRAIQLAKGAIAAGIRILMKEYGIEDQWHKIDRVILAGGFGYYLNPADAAAIGLLPEELIDKTLGGGNTALAGARKLGCQLLSEAVKTTSEKLPDRICGMLDIGGTEILNLAEHPQFESLYFEHMSL